MCFSEQQTSAPKTSAQTPITLPTAFVDDIRSVLELWRHEGQALALATLVNFEGKSPRPIGSQMLVSAQGASVGLISGGCIESAIVEEAKQCIKADTPRLVRYGKGSDYIDIHLPCGSGLDIYIQPLQGESWLAELQQAFFERREIYWTLTLDSGAVELSTTRHSHTPDTINASQNQQLSRLERDQLQHFSKLFRPLIRVAVYGSGAVFDYFVAMAALHDFELIRLEQGAHSLDGSAWEYELDSNSAFVSLSHEHEGEAGIIARALSRPVFYIAALGSTATHASRIEALKAMQCTETDIGRVKGPAGLDLSAKTPVEIATSILAELIAQKNYKLR